MFATRPFNGRSRLRRDFGTSDALVLLPLRTLIFRMPTLVRSLTPVPCERTAQISSGFPLGFSPMSCSRECRFPDAPKCRWRWISATCLLQWMVQIPSGFRDLRCLDSYDLENPEFPMADIPMTNPVQLPQIRRLSGICLRSDDSDLFSSCAPPPEANLRVTPPDLTTVGISFTRSTTVGSSLLCASSGAPPGRELINVPGLFFP
jgi:hypothetical protein